MTLPFNQTTKIAAGVLVILVGGYFAYTSINKKPVSISALESEAVSQSALAREVVALLSRLESIKLDKSLFDDPVFKSLKDYTQQIQIEEVGRANPFAPVGSEDFSAPPPSAPPTPRRP